MFEAATRTLIAMHREEVKAAIRMKHGSLKAFAATEGLKSQQVRDLLRGQSSLAKSAVARLLRVEPDQLIITSDSTTVEAHNTGIDAPHRIIAKGR